MTSGDKKEIEPPVLDMEVLADVAKLALREQVNVLERIAEAQREADIKWFKEHQG